MGIFTEMCNCPNQEVASASQKINIKNDLENNAIMNPEHKDSLEEKNGKKKNNNNETNNDAETYNMSLKGGMMASKRKKKQKDKISNKGTEKISKRTKKIKKEEKDEEDNKYISPNKRI